MSGRLFTAGERLQAAKLNRLGAVLTTGVVTEAPVDDATYVRQNAQWLEVPQRATVETVSASTQTPAIGTDGRYFICTNASGCAVTIPTNEAQAFPIGTMLTYQQNDNDSVTFTPDGGVTLRTPAAYLAETAEQYAVVQLVKVATNEWVIYGHLLAA